MRAEAIERPSDFLWPNSSQPPLVNIAPLEGYMEIGGTTSRRAADILLIASCKEIAM